MSRRSVLTALGLGAAVVLMASLAGPPTAASTARAGGTGPSPVAAGAPSSVDLVLADAPRTDRGDARVIVQATSVATAARAVEAAGGTVERPLLIVNGVAATVPPPALARLATAAGVQAVTPNEVARPAASSTTTTPASSAPRSVFNRELGVDRVRSYGITGRGATVAVIDTGIARVPDLASRAADGTLGPSRVVAVPDPDAPQPNPGEAPRTAPCANFSGEGRSDAAGCRDDHGHGTFMAGLIAGNGQASGGRYTGVAPEASIADIKIGGRTGAADVSKILAAIQYVVVFRDTIQPPVRAINLSLGTTSRQHYRHDPLNYAVQRAWTAGLTVVVSAGNTGPPTAEGAAGNRGTISKPGDDPLVITVGAVDDLDSPTIEDDRLPEFTGRGPAWFAERDGQVSDERLAKPDVVAPGAHVVSLRPVDAGGTATPTEIPAPSEGSWHTSHYRRGSGTSMATAMVSGVAALYAQTRGSQWGVADPDRFKAALKKSARTVASKDPNAVGAGLVDAPWTLVFAHVDDHVKPTPMSAQGDGLLGLSRGDAVVTSRPCTAKEKLLNSLHGDLQPCPVVIDGERTAQDMAWDSEARRAFTDGSSWYGSSWYGSSWYGSSWYASSWNGSSWYGSSWYGSSWYGSFDEGARYGDETTTVNGSSWYGAWD